MDHRDLAKHVNTLVYHSRMVDSLDDMLNETSDLSIYWSVSLFISVCLCLSACSVSLVCRVDPVCVKQMNDVISDNDGGSDSDSDDDDDAVSTRRHLSVSSSSVWSFQHSTVTALHSQ